jgi:hypothetical protein
MFAKRRGMRRHAPRSATAQSGPLPEIRLLGESVVFYLQVATGDGPSRLLLRCDPAGEVWASLDDGADRGSGRADHA